MHHLNAYVRWKHPAFACTTTLAAAVVTSGSVEVRPNSAGKRNTPATTFRDHAEVSILLAT
jgi:hypothetical protein